LNLAYDTFNEEDAIAQLASNVGVSPSQVSLDEKWYGSVIAVFTVRGSQLLNTLNETDMTFNASVKDSSNQEMQSIQNMVIAHIQAGTLINGTARFVEFTATGQVYFNDTQYTVNCTAGLTNVCRAFNRLGCASSINVSRDPGDLSGLYELNVGNTTVDCGACVHGYFPIENNTCCAFAADMKCDDGLAVFIYPPSSSSAIKQSSSASISVSSSSHQSTVPGSGSSSHQSAVTGSGSNASSSATRLGGGRVALIHALSAVLLSVLSCFKHACVDGFLQSSYPV